MFLPNNKASAAALFAIAIVFAGASAAFAVQNVPSINQVYEAARSGQLARAEAMTREVLRAYPNSARARYVMAQILAAEGRGSEARAYLEQAERLKPGLPFANPRSVAMLERRIASETQSSTVSHSGTYGIRWWWIAVGAIVVFLLARTFSRGVASSSSVGRDAAAGDASPRAGTPSAGYASSPGYAGGLLSSVLAGLGFGAAAAAGQRMMERLLGGGQEQVVDPSPTEQLPQASDDLGGDAFGVQPGSDSTGGWEDSSDQSDTASDLGDDFSAGNGGDGGWDDSSGGGGDIDL